MPIIYCSYIANPFDLVPLIQVFATYNDENSLSQLTLTWQQVKVIIIIIIL